MVKQLDKRKLFEQIKYQPHPKQWLYHNSQARFRVPCCGRRFGKSTMAGKDEEAKLFMPRKRGWIVGPTYDLAEKEFRVIWDDLIVGMQMGRDRRIKKAYNKRSGEMYIEFPWQTRLECRSADHPENLVGESLDFVIMSEAAKHKKETWERFIMPSLADKRGSATFPTTPEGFNWLYDIWMLGQNPDFPEYESWTFPSWDNPVVYPGGRNDPEIKLIQRTQIEAWFKQEIGADFSSFVGKIYEEWDDTAHIKKLQFHPEWPNYIAFDWGFTNPLAAIEFQISPDDTIYIWREHYKSFLMLEDHVRQLKGRTQPEGYHLDLAFGDAADPEAAEYISRHLAPCYAMPEAKQNWRLGVDRVKSFLKLWETGGVIDEYGTPEQVPHLFVDWTCQNTIKEFNNYRSKEPVAGKNVPEMGQKMADHALDAIRYALVHIYDLGITYHLTDMADLYDPARAAQYTREPDSGLYVPAKATGTYGAAVSSPESSYDTTFNMGMSF